VESALKNPYSQSHASGLNMDACKFLLFAICIPINPKHLLSLRMCDLFFDQNTVVITQKQRLLQQEYKRYFSISNQIRNILALYVTPTNKSGYIFETLMSMKKNEREKVLRDHIFRFWEFFNVKLDDFRLFFEDYAIKESPLKAGFIKATMQGTVNKLPVDQPFQILLMDWWLYSLNQN
jgi:hypothetical protein